MNSPFKTGFPARVSALLFSAILAAPLLVPTHSVAQNRGAAAALNNQALVVAQEGKYAEAIAMFNQALANSPDHQTILYNRASTFLRAGQPNDALKDANRVMEIDPLSLDGLRLRSRIFLALDQDEKALADADELMRLSPDDPQAALGRSHLLLHAGRYGASLDAQFYALSLVQTQKALSQPIGQETQQTLGTNYALLGLPNFGGFKSRANETPAAFNALFEPKVGELRFEGLVASAPKAGTLQFDVLAVTFPGGKTKTLQTPKRRIASVKGLKFRNASEKAAETWMPQVGDFVTLTGKDTGKLISPRVGALALRKLPDVSELLKTLEKTGVEQPKTDLEETPQ